MHKHQWQLHKILSKLDDSEIDWLIQNFMDAHAQAVADHRIVPVAQAVDHVVPVLAVSMFPAERETMINSIQAWLNASCDLDREYEKTGKYPGESQCT